MSSYKLYYFNGRGRAEIARLIFAAAGRAFEDIRYDHNEWKSHKPQTLLGQIPILEFNGVKLPQSLSIARFLAKQFQLAGRDNFEQAKVDAVIDTISDAAIPFVPLWWEKNPTKKQEGMRKFFSEELPKHLQNLEVLGKLYGNGGPFFVNNHLTWADLYFYDKAQNFLQVEKNLLNTYPWLKHNRQQVETQPKISAYLKNRPETLF